MIEGFGQPLNVKIFQKNFTQAIFFMKWHNLKGWDLKLSKIDKI